MVSAMGVPEYVEPFASDGVCNTLDIIDAQEVLGQPDTREEFWAAMDFDTYKQWLNTIHASFSFYSPDILQDAKSGNVFIATADGQNNHSTWLNPHYKGPHADDREALLQEAFDVSKQQDDPTTAATLQALALNTIHLPDGTGRLSRVMYALRVHGYDGSKTDRALFATLGSHQGRELLHFNQDKGKLPTTFVAHVLRQNGHDLSRAIEFEPRMATNMRWKCARAIGATAFIEPTLTEAYFSLPLLADRMRELGQSMNDHVVTEASTGQPLVHFDLTALYPGVPVQTQKAIKARSRALKRQYVESIIDSFRPDNPAPLHNPAELTEIYAMTTPDL